ncbi:MAG: VapE domain-containing protein [Clostridium sp.]
MSKIDNIKNDKEIIISIGRSRFEKLWREKKLTWSEFLNRVSRGRITSETMEEYRAMGKKEQDKIKDVGGFVGASLVGGKRGRTSVKFRSLITLDMDFLPSGFMEKGFKGEVYDKLNFPFCVYSTHKHKKESPRLRLVIPIDREVSPEEYEAISRRVAFEIGMEYFDDTTYEPCRLMYWPSSSKDGEFIFIYKDSGEALVEQKVGIQENLMYKHTNFGFLKADEYLSKYDDWTKVEQWHQSKRIKEKRKSIYKTQQNPKEKKGVIGSFCRAFSIQEAIKEFLGGVYEPCTSLSGEERFTYKKGSSYGGVVVYGDFAYSHHGTDPAGGRLLNSFDMVRIHLFGHLDKDFEGIGANKPSFKKMIDFAIKNERIREQITRDKFNEIESEFEENRDIAKECSNEKKMNLVLDKEGNIKSCIQNVEIILREDKNLKERISYNLFSRRIIKKGSLPWWKIEENGWEQWQDADHSGLRSYLEKGYGICSERKVYDGLVNVAMENSYHPVKDYLNSLRWDGEKRVETLLIDYLGAVDTPYTRAVTKKVIAAGVARIFNPGVKFDYMMVLVGRQGIGKSQIISKLGGEWYSDSLITVQGKEAYEAIDNTWIVEMAELSATKRAEIEAVKHFISKQEDVYRKAYGRETVGVKRQCVFIGTTNESEFLKDRTGNRRFWPVTVGVIKERVNLWKDFSDYERDQVWAEGMELYKLGEELYLDKEMSEMAMSVQEKHTEENAKVGMVCEYLNMLLPENWDELDIMERRNFIHNRGCFNGGGEVKIQRSKVCAPMVLRELFRLESKDITPARCKEVGDIILSIPGWKRHEGSRGRLRFGNDYGLQKAFVRDE